MRLPVARSVRPVEPGRSGSSPRVRAALLDRGADLTEEGSPRLTSGVCWISPELGENVVMKLLTCCLWSGLVIGASWMPLRAVEDAADGYALPYPSGIARKVLQAY